MPSIIALVALLAASLSYGAEAPRAHKIPKKVDPKALPYLGPGADKLSAEDYERVYRNYIQTSVLLGYPFLKEKAEPCDQALSTIFRGAGMFGYPVPPEAQQIQKSEKVMGGNRVETYELGGFLLQLARNAKTKAPEKLVLVNSGSAKATRRLSQLVKHELLSLEKDPVTGLEKVKGVPVGYRSPFLTSEGQGLFVKILRFNGKVEGCRPLDFLDNAWTSGFDLSDARCTELQTEAEMVWGEKMSPDAFAKKETERMKKTALDAALKRGTKEAEAKALIEKHFKPPFTNEINVVGNAMRNLAQCNLLALGRAGGKRAPGAPAEGGASGSGSKPGTGAGSAQ